MNKIKTRTRSEVYHLWLKNLRSGKYKQAHGCMRSVHPFTGRVYGFCCLGVLQDMAVCDGGPKWDKYWESPRSTSGTPNTVLLDFMGLEGAMVNHLIDMNDLLGATFDEIADEIEFNIMPALDIK